MPEVIVLNTMQSVLVIPPETPTVIVSSAPTGTANLQPAFDAIEAHRVSPTPHPAYDVELQSLALLFANRSV